jgi:hypothetical protein
VEAFMNTIRCFTLCALLVALLSACAFSRQVNIRSHPSGAQAWLEGEPLGPTPTKARAKTTGPIPNFTFDPEFVTFELEGHERAVRPFDYEWSMRNVACVLGIPWWGKEPVDLWVVLTPEAGKAASGEP